MDILCLIGIGVLFGGMAMFCGIRLWDYHKNKEAEQRKRDEDQKQREADLQCQMKEMTRELENLRDQLKGKQLPFFVRDGLEDIKSLENNDSLDLARIRLFLEETMKTVDQAADRQKKMADIYNYMRNHTKNIK